MNKNFKYHKHNNSLLFSIKIDKKLFLYTLISKDCSISQSIIFSKRIYKDLSNYKREVKKSKLIFKIEGWELSKNNLNNIVKNCYVKFKTFNRVCFFECKNFLLCNKLR